MNSMEKEFVPYEIALKLKGLRFNEAVFAVYGYNGEDKNTLFQLEHICRMEEYALNPIDLRNSNIGDDVSAPLYQQVFRWFREKHNLNCNVWSNHIKWYWAIKNLETDCYETIESPEYLTYEDAELDCLKELIQTVKYDLGS